ncbi:flagellar basal body L-ring protein FlgH [Thalassobaculum sp. OXR-137]|uniref:flagellar basal body L-ring protein FlgH n=1 Tax=Thalassobaculum sp. OXR-137 TaxID=3100173 RepID=UPI002AC8F91A|nr:flagellar basal body L-ring protein FlgH [Thalassobaculum sp. OXR-137]WPZ34164.1 flagellar basal body L-ring protein FlgH [Thalassobaculum sp. OXR-137]
MTRLSSPIRIRPLLGIAAAAVLLSGCNAIDRLSNLGQAPEMSRIQDPTQSAGYQPISMPMPAPVVATRQANSLWQEGSRAFFKDQRASDIGDIITVVVQINDEAAVTNTTTRTRANSEGASLGGLFGYEGSLGQVFPEAVTGENLVDLGSNSSNVGSGEVDREEEINIRIAAVITQKLPNGNLVLYGRQEVRVNFEVREIVVGGVIRAADITSRNTISYDQMAEARIAYGGRGQLTDVQQPRYGSQVLDIIMPF